MQIVNDKQALAWQEKQKHFEAYLQQSGLAHHTINAYVRDVCNFLDWLIKQTEQEFSTNNIAVSDIEKYKCYLLDAVEQSPTSINRSLQSLRKFGSFMLATEGFNPIQEISLLEGIEPTPPITLTGAEVTRLVETAKTRPTRTAVRDYAILQLLLQTGIRVSELVNLQLEDVAITKNTTTLVVRGRKEHLTRRLPLPPTSCAALQAYLQQPRPPQTANLFLGREGNPLSIRSVQQIFANLGKSAGIKVSARMLRNTFARSLWQETGNLDLLARRMGYKNVGATLRHIIMSRK